MKADIPLAERRRIEREQQAEIRAMLAPRHFATMHAQMAIDATLPAWSAKHSLMPRPPSMRLWGARMSLRRCPHLWPCPNPLCRPHLCR